MSDDTALDKNRRLLLRQSLLGAGAIAAGASGIVGDASAAAPAKPAVASTVRTTQPAKLRSLLRGEPFFSLMVDNLLDMRLAEIVGFKHAFLSGGSPAKMFGLPDLGLISAPEIIEQARVICDNSDLPLMIDLEDSHGSPLQLNRWIRMSEQAGASGVLFEDVVAHSHLGTPHTAILPKSVMLDRIRAAVDARRDADFVLCAGSTGSREDLAESETIDRAHAYAEAGADMVWIPRVSAAVSKRAQAEIKKPLLGNPTGDVSLLKEAGINLAVVTPLPSLRLGASKLIMEDLFRTGIGSETLKMTYALQPDVTEKILGARAVEEQARKYHMIK